LRAAAKFKKSISSHRSLTVDDLITSAASLFNRLSPHPTKKVNEWEEGTIREA
jgi:hypothetical protein